MTSVVCDRELTLSYPLPPTDGPPRMLLDRQDSMTERERKHKEARASSVDDFGPTFTFASADDLASMTTIAADKNIPSVLQPPPPPPVSLSQRCA